MVMACCDCLERGICPLAGPLTGFCLDFLFTDSVEEMSAVTVRVKNCDMLF